MRKRYGWETERRSLSQVIKDVYIETLIPFTPPRLGSILKMCERGGGGEGNSRKWTYEYKSSMNTRGGTPTTPMYPQKTARNSGQNIKTTNCRHWRATPAGGQWRGGTCRQSIGRKTRHHVSEDEMCRLQPNIPILRSLS